MDVTYPLTSILGRRPQSVGYDVCRKDREDGLTVERRLESPIKKMAFTAEPFMGL
jgi:hypothetical protein